MRTCRDVELVVLTIKDPAVTIELGEKEDDDPDGRPCTLIVTFPVNPPTAANGHGVGSRLAAFDPIEPGVAETVKSLAAVTTRLTVDVRVESPLVPAIVSGYVPGAAMAKVVMLSCEVPEAVTADGENVAVPN